VCARRHTRFVIDVIIGPDGNPVAGPTGSVIGTLRLRKARSPSKLGGGWVALRPQAEQAALPHRSAQALRVT
jgi:hypothetical protein